MTPDQRRDQALVDASRERDGVSRRGALKILAGLLGLIAWPWRTARAAEPAPLRVKFTTGQTLRYLMTTESKMQGSANGREFSQAMVSDMVLTWKVLRVSPNRLASIEQVTERSRLDMENPGMEIKLDTVKPADEKEKLLPKELQAVTNGIRNTIGKPIELTVNPRGEIDEISFSQEFLDALGMPKEFMEFGFKRDKPLKRRGELGLIELPAKALAVGQSSDEPRSLHNPVTDKNIEYVFKYTRKPPEKVGGREVARVDYVMEFDLESVQGLGAQQYGAAGKILLDEQAGVIVRIDYKQVMALELEQAAKATPGGNLADIKGKNVQTVTRTTRLLAADEDPFAEKQGD